MNKKNPRPFVGLAVVAFLLFLPATTAKLCLGKGKGWLFTADGFYYYSYALSLVLGGDLDFSNQYRFSKGVGNPKEREAIVPTTGHPANIVGIGGSIAMASGVSCRAWIVCLAASERCADRLRVDLPTADLPVELPCWADGNVASLSAFSENL